MSSAILSPTNYKKLPLSPKAYKQLPINTNDMTESLIKSDASIQDLKAQKNQTTQIPNSSGTFLSFGKRFVAFAAGVAVAFAGAALVSSAAAPLFTGAVFVSIIVATSLAIYMPVSYTITLALTHNKEDAYNTAMFPINVVGLTLYIFVKLVENNPLVCLCMCLN